MDASSPFSFHELRRQASSYLTDKIRSARLALTDVTPTQLMTEEATSGDASPPNVKTMSLIARQAFEIDEYVRISDILHKRFARFDRRQWREAYKALLLLEHLLTHGPRSVALEFQRDREVIEQMVSFQHIDEKGFNWGMTVKSKSERVLRLLERGPFLEDERERARKIAHEIKGFGSFNLSSAHASGSAAAALRAGAMEHQCYGRSNSRYEGRWRREACVDDGDKENLLVVSMAEAKAEAAAEEPHHYHHPFYGFGQQRPEAMLLLSQ
ncbi:unknown protein [Oryza sativa Japonica Group]|uniref:Os01g0841000 protein n=2 Tax=Oryza sativa subsp. japonica TaxID=39947 RepID=B9EUC6_ORYSJ|nr:epsin-3 [Oryza sativa Japonica Group]KAB8084235.1 hypothetical protein EE612_006737 [Oryza sativa]EEE55647.1 hypothetical protein OsJ_04029 [Oryza sativa Japonica Group]KAB8084236.1 hypothetical protein EE612_006737 [Oryza sativa]KAF2953243.1 hypothetical protein DAI22_01g394800 [Oryza sativa Japonica Group]BAD81760.1 unknown protein [Oryza sativa Japonica Group]|eukprot:NP_001044763.1 Os01g0841000 [Oryza sativa Japonica Group]